MVQLLVPSPTNSVSFPPFSSHQLCFLPPLFSSYQLCFLPFLFTPILFHTNSVSSLSHLPPSPVPPPTLTSLSHLLPSPVPPPILTCSSSHPHLFLLPPSPVPPPTLTCSSSHPHLFLLPPSPVPPPTLTCSSSHPHLFLLPPSPVPPPTLTCSSSHPPLSSLSFSPGLHPPSHLPIFQPPFFTLHHWIPLHLIPSSSSSYTIFPLSSSHLLSINSPPSSLLSINFPSLHPTISYNSPLLRPQFIALLAFAITAGFNSGSTNNSLTCLGNNTNTTASSNLTAYMTFSYPYTGDNFDLMPESVDNMTICTMAPSTRFGTPVLSTSAQFFVAMGVLTMLYVVGAVLVYLMFITPDLFLAKWLVIGVSVGYM